MKLTLLENLRWTSASSWRLFFSWVQASPRVLEAKKRFSCRNSDPLKQNQSVWQKGAEQMFGLWLTRQLAALTPPPALPGGSETAWTGSWRTPPQSLSWNADVKPSAVKHKLFESQQEKKGFQSDSFASLFQGWAQVRPEGPSATAAMFVPFISSFCGGLAPTPE